MPDSTGLLPFSERFPERFFDVGIAEQHATTAAAGMAMSGLRPVVAIYATFLNRAFDQIAFDVGLHELPVIFCLDRAGITGPDGASHHGLLDMMLMSKIPGMTLFAPSSYQELQQMFQDALKLLMGRCVFDIPELLHRLFTKRKLARGNKLAKFRRGMMYASSLLGKSLEPAKKAANDLKQHGIGCSVWDVRCVAPIDGDMLEDAHRHPVVVTIEDGITEGGIGSTIQNKLSRFNDACPIVRTMESPPYVPQGNADEILSHLGLDSEALQEKSCYCNEFFTRTKNRTLIKKRIFPQPHDL